MYVAFHNIPSAFIKIQKNINLKKSKKCLNIEIYKNMSVYMWVCRVCKCIFTDDQRGIGQIVLFQYHSHFHSSLLGSLDFHEDL